MTSELADIPRLPGGRGRLLEIASDRRRARPPRSRPRRAAHPRVSRDAVEIAVGQQRPHASAPRCRGRPAPARRRRSRPRGWPRRCGRRRCRASPSGPPPAASTRTSSPVTCARHLGETVGEQLPSGTPIQSRSRVAPSAGILHCRTPFGNNVRDRGSRWQSSPSSGQRRSSAHSPADRGGSACPSCPTASVWRRARSTACCGPCRPRASSSRTPTPASTSSARRCCSSATSTSTSTSCAAARSRGPTRSPSAPARRCASARCTATA